MTEIIVAGAAVVILAVVVAGGIARSRRRGPARRPPYVVALGALVDGDRETALKEFKNAVRLDTSNVDAYLRLGDLLRERGDAERAFQLHRELASRPGLAKELLGKVHAALCRDHVALGNLPKAAEAAREAARLFPDPLPAMRVLLEVLEKLEDLPGAFQVKKDLLKREGRVKSGAGELAEYRAGQAESVLEKGDLREAEKILREARRIDPACPRARRAWGRLRERLGDYAGAVEAWEELLRDDPEQGEAIFRDLERVHFLDGTFGDMEGTYGRFLDRNPGHEGASLGLAGFLRRKGQIDDALDACGRGLSAHPDSAPLRLLQLALLLQVGRTGEAEATLNDWIAQSLGEGEPHPDPSALEAPSR